MVQVFYNINFSFFYGVKKILLRIFENYFLDTYVNVFITYSVYRYIRVSYQQKYHSRVQSLSRNGNHVSRSTT